MELEVSMKMEPQVKASARILTREEEEDLGLAQSAVKQPGKQIVMQLLIRTDLNRRSKGSLVAFLHQAMVPIISSHMIRPRKCSSASLLSSQACKTGLTSSHSS